MANQSRYGRSCQAIHSRHKSAIPNRSNNLRGLFVGFAVRHLKSRVARCDDWAGSRCCYIGIHRPSKSLGELSDSCFSRAGCGERLDRPWHCRLQLVIHTPCGPGARQRSTALHIRLWHNGIHISLRNSFSAVVNAADSSRLSRRFPKPEGN